MPRLLLEALALLISSYAGIHQPTAARALGSHPTA